MLQHTITNCGLYLLNGDRYDNRRENLEALCPNCHSQTDTFCNKNGKNTKRGICMRKYRIKRIENLV